MKVVTERLPDPRAYDPDALARDVDHHRAEKMRGETGHAPEVARAWLLAARMNACEGGSPGYEAAHGSDDDDG